MFGRAIPLSFINEGLFDRRTGVAQAAGFADEPKPPRKLVSSGDARVCCRGRYLSL